MRTDGVHCQEYAGTGPVNLKVVLVTGAAFAGHHVPILLYDLTNVFRNSNFVFHSLLLLVSLHVISVLVQFPGRPGG